MATLKYNCTNRTKICQICEDRILPTIWCLHLSNSSGDKFFHEGCMYRALDSAKQSRITYLIKSYLHKELN